MEHQKIQRSVNAVLALKKGKTNMQLLQEEEEKEKEAMQKLSQDSGEAEESCRSPQKLKKAKTSDAKNDAADGQGKRLMPTCKIETEIFTSTGTAANSQSETRTDRPSKICSFKIQNENIITKVLSSGLNSQSCTEKTNEIHERTKEIPQGSHSFQNEGCIEMQQENKALLQNDGSGKENTEKIILARHETRKVLQLSNHHFISKSSMKLQHENETFEIDENENSEKTSTEETRDASTLNMSFNDKNFLEAQQEIEETLQNNKEKDEDTKNTQMENKAIRTTTSNDSSEKEQAGQQNKILITHAIGAKIKSTEKLKENQSEEISTRDDISGNMVGMEIHTENQSKNPHSSKEIMTNKKADLEVPTLEDHLKERCMEIQEVLHSENNIQLSDGRSKNETFMKGDKIVPQDGTKISNNNSDVCRENLEFMWNGQISFNKKAEKFHIELLPTDVKEDAKQMPLQAICDVKHKERNIVHKTNNEFNQVSTSREDILQKYHDTIKTEDDSQIYNKINIPPQQIKNSSEKGFAEMTAQKLDLGENGNENKLNADKNIVKFDIKTDLDGRNFNLTDNENNKKCKMDTTMVINNHELGKKYKDKECDEKILKMELEDKHKNVKIYKTDVIPVNKSTSPNNCPKFQTLNNSNIQASTKKENVSVTEIPIKNGKIVNIIYGEDDDNDSRNVKMPINFNTKSEENKDFAFTLNERNIKERETITPTNVHLETSKFLKDNTTQSNKIQNASNLNHKLKNIDSDPIFITEVHITKGQVSSIDQEKQSEQGQNTTKKIHGSSVHSSNDKYKSEGEKTPSSKDTMNSGFVTEVHIIKGNVLNVDAAKQKHAKIQKLEVANNSNTNCCNMNTNDELKSLKKSEEYKRPSEIVIKTEKIDNKKSVNIKKNDNISSSSQFADTSKEYEKQNDDTIKVKNDIRYDNEAKQQNILDDKNKMNRASILENEFLEITQNSHVSQNSLTHTDAKDIITDNKNERNKTQKLENEVTQNSNISLILNDVKNSKKDVSVKIKESINENVTTNSKQSKSLSEVNKGIKNNDNNLLQNKENTNVSDIPQTSLTLCDIQNDERKVSDDEKKESIKENVPRKAKRSKSLSEVNKSVKNNGSNLFLYKESADINDMPDTLSEIVIKRKKVLPPILPNTTCTIDSIDESSKLVNESTSGNQTPLKMLQDTKILSETNETDYSQKIITLTDSNQENQILYTDKKYLNTAQNTNTVKHEVNYNLEKYSYSSQNSRVASESNSSKRLPNENFLNISIGNTCSSPTNHETNQNSNQALITLHDTRSEELEDAAFQILNDQTSSFRYNTDTIQSFEKELDKIKSELNFVTRNLQEPEEMISILDIATNEPPDTEDIPNSQFTFDWTDNDVLADLELSEECSLVESIYETCLTDDEKCLISKNDTLQASITAFSKENIFPREENRRTPVKVELDLKDEENFNLCCDSTQFQQAVVLRDNVEFAACFGNENRQFSPKDCDEEDSLTVPVHYKSDFNKTNEGRRFLDVNYEKSTDPLKIFIEKSVTSENRNATSQFNDSWSSSYKSENIREAMPEQRIFGGISNYLHPKPLSKIFDLGLQEQDESNDADESILKEDDNQSSDDEVFTEPAYRSSKINTQRSDHEETTGSFFTRRAFPKQNQGRESIHTLLIEEID